MKSIMEEASSIIKAIEKGWANAGNPKEFTIKVFEEPQKNFIGMTVRPAKIGIFFHENAPQKTGEPQQKRRRPDQERHKQSENVNKEIPARTQRQPVAPAREAPKKEMRMQPQERIARNEGAPAEMEQRQGPIWSDEMIATIQEWLTQLLPLMGVEANSFAIHADHFHLKVDFNKDVVADKSREKYVFASLSHLLLTMLKRHYKRPLKGYKIVLVGL